MRISGGFALSASLIFFTAVILAMLADDTLGGASRRRLAAFAWMLFTTAVLTMMAAIWVAVAGR